MTMTKDSQRDEVILLMKDRYQIFSNGIPTIHKGNDLDKLKEQAEYFAKLFGSVHQIVDKFGRTVFETKEGR